MWFWFGFYEATDRFDGLSKSQFEIGGFVVCLVSALGSTSTINHTDELTPS